jgi:hypothetical protein
VNESSCGVAITHLGWDLALVGDEKRAGQRSIVPKRAVYRTGGTRPDTRQYVGRGPTLLAVSGGMLGRGGCDGENRGCREYQRQRRPFGSSAVQ